MPSISYNLTATNGTPPFAVSVKKLGEVPVFERCTTCQATQVGANTENYNGTGLAKGVNHTMILEVSKAGCGTQTVNFNHCCPSTGGSLNCPTGAINVGSRTFTLSGFDGIIAVVWSVNNGGTVQSGQSTLDATINFPSAGTYTVTATITDECGRNSPINCILSVQSVPCSLSLSVTGVNACS